MDGVGVLLQGASGAGKSDLALRLIDSGALLVADDYTRLRASAGRVYAAPPPEIAGLLEVRGLGILRLPTAALPVPLAVIIALTAARDDIPRLPETETLTILGVSVRTYRIAPFEASAPLKVRLAVGLATRGIMELG
jgi:serine kinase of HPr protein (carbohydrate metabolism regulator)